MSHTVFLPLSTPTLPFRVCGTAEHSLLNLLCTNFISDHLSGNPTGDFIHFLFPMWKRDNLKVNMVSIFKYKNDLYGGKVSLCPLAPEEKTGTHEQK